MADYWKSQAKKYCEFCKCWIADNRPSVEFHEKGRKHKENVARKLRTITKQSHRDQRESARMDTALKRMERAAMEAYRKDIEANADISSRAINETLEQQNLTLSSKNIWHEVKKDGVTLYKNTETNESVKTPPSCGYLSLAEQQASVFATGKKQLQKLEKFRNTQDSLKAEDEKKQQEEDRAAAQREKMKALRVVEPEPEPVVVPGPILEQRTGIYAPWKAVEQRPKTQLNLQLPKQEEYVAAITLPVEKPETKKNFKEKTVTSLEPEVSQDGGESSGVEFKKRKFIGNKNRNTRQRLDND